MARKLPDELDFIRTSRLPQKANPERAENKTVLITGASSGVGLATAIHFAGKGASLVLLTRNKEKAEFVKNKIKVLNPGGLHFYHADLESPSEIASTLDKMNAELNRIDILINNAGAFRTRKKITPEGIDAVYTVNQLSAFLITINLLPLLMKSEDPRILHVNSEGHRFSNVRLNDLAWKKRIYTGLRSYGASKSAQLHCMYMLKEPLDNNGIFLNSMHPGAVRSDIGKKSGWLYQLYYKFLVMPFLKDPQISAEAIYYLTTSREMKGKSGEFYNLTNVESPAPHAQRSAFSEKVFFHTIHLLQKYMEATGIKEIDQMMNTKR